MSMSMSHHIHHSFTQPPPTTHQQTDRHPTGIYGVVEHHQTNKMEKKNRKRKEKRKYGITQKSPCIKRYLRRTGGVVVNKK
jgi:hypothetical protein